MVFFNKLKFLTHQPFQFLNKVINAGNHNTLKLLNVLNVSIPLSKMAFLFGSDEFGSLVAGAKCPLEVGQT